MKALSYTLSLLPSVQRNKVIEDIGVTRSIVNDSAMEAYTSALPFFKSWKFKSKDLKPLLDTFDRSVKGAGNDNMVVTIQKSFEPMLKNLEEMEDLVKRMFNQEESGAGISYLKSNILQFVECASFVARFSVKLLNYIYICETSQYEDGEAIAKSLKKAEIDWIEQNMYNFCLALRVVTGNPGQVKKQVMDVPDVLVTAETADSLAETLGDSRLDPLMMNFIPVKLNPIYHIRMFYENYLNDCYKAAKAERDMVNLRKMNLELLAGGKNDAAIQKEIKYLADRAEDLNYKIKKMEGDHD